MAVRFVDFLPQLRKMAAMYSICSKSRKLRKISIRWVEPRQNREMILWGAAGRGRGQGSASGWFHRRKRTFSWAKSSWAPAKGDRTGWEVVDRMNGLMIKSKTIYFLEIRLHQITWKILRDRWVWIADGRPNLWDIVSIAWTED